MKLTYIFNFLIQVTIFHLRRCVNQEVLPWATQQVTEKTHFAKNRSVDHIEFSIK